MTVKNMIPKVDRIVELEGSFVPGPGQEPSAEMVSEFQFDGSLAEEGYVLEILPERICITSKTEAGRYYAMQTLSALTEENHGILDCCRIQDEPKYSYRGFMIDVSRHFFSVAEIKKIVDRCAKYKLNKFHWHLSDDQGFRIESRRFPKLNQIGSVRREEDGTVSRGFYTQEEIREVVAYAAERYVEVIPEIDMPGHTSAIIASYPQLSCSGKKAEVKNKGGIYPQILCAGREETLQFLYELLDEIVPLFPGQYFHIGGDEAPKEEWKKCEACQSVIRRENLNGEEELQAYFTKKLIGHLAAKGKKVIAWNDTLASGKVDNVTAQYWMEPGEGYSYREAARGQKFIFSNFNAFYMDYPYGMVTLKAMYSFEPNIQGNTAIPKEQILGLEAPVWTEQIATEQKLERQIFPRIQALAENAWSRQKDYNDFLRRVKLQEESLAAAGIEYTAAEDADLSAEEGIRQIVEWQKVMIRTHIALTPEISREAMQEYIAMGKASIAACMQNVYTEEEQERAAALFVSWLEQEAGQAAKQR